MLDSNDRRPAFDAFYASLDAAVESVFIHEAMEQRASIQSGEHEPVSLIDCMENVWDEWQDIAKERRQHTNGEVAVLIIMEDHERILREDAFRIASPRLGIRKD